MKYFFANQQMLLFICRLWNFILACILKNYLVVSSGFLCFPFTGMISKSSDINWCIAHNIYRLIYADKRQLLQNMRLWIVLSARRAYAVVVKMYSPIKNNTLSALARIIITCLKNECEIFVKHNRQRTFGVSQKPF